LVYCESDTDECGSNAGIDFIPSRSLEIMQQIVVSMHGFRIVCAIGNGMFQSPQFAFHLMKASEWAVHGFP